MNVGKIVFAQIMQFIPRREFNDIVAKYRGNYRVRNLTCHDQLLVMCLAQYADKKSLRDIEASLNALAVTHKLYHCGISYAVPRNTLAKANEPEIGISMRNWGKSLSKRCARSMRRIVSDLTLTTWSMRSTAVPSVSVSNFVLGQNSERRRVALNCIPSLI